MKLGRLLDAVHAVHLGQHLVQQSGAVEQLEGAARVAFGEHLGQLVADALAAHLLNARRQALDGGEGFRLDGVAEARGEAHRAQHAQLVLGEAALRIADGADDAGLQVVAAADKIEHAIVVQRVHQQAVDGEVAALHVLLRVFGVADAVGMASVGVGAVVAEGRDLDVVRMLGRNGRWRRLVWVPNPSFLCLAGSFQRYQHNAELRADGVGLREDAHDLRRRGIGGDIVIGGGDAEQRVADAASGEISLEAAVAKLANDIGGMCCMWIIALSHLELILACVRVQEAARPP